MEINEIENRKVIEKINETKSCFFERINKIGKPLAILIKQKKSTNKIRNERQITINSIEIRKIIKEYSEQLYTNKLDNLEVMDTFSRNIQPSKTKPGRNRESEQTNY